MENVFSSHIICQTTKQTKLETMPVLTKVSTLACSVRHDISSHQCQRLKICIALQNAKVRDLSSLKLTIDPGLSQGEKLLQFTSGGETS